MSAPDHLARRLAFIRLDSTAQGHLRKVRESAASARMLLDQIEQLNRLVAAFRTEPQP